ncbi:HTTM domain-containing protein [Nocardioides sp. NPDC023903]|uniref:HTTM domain-containing protein n=1 Tax=Nocardioides sp. NPDC023903 TaxID=3157195 RepID=UPI0033FB4186
MTRFSPRSTFAVADVRIRRLTFDQLSLFTMLWAGQGLIQLLTYEYFPRDALFGLLLVATLAAIVLPNRTLALATMLVLNLAYSWAHMPYQVNHHLLEDCINLILLGALAIAWMRRRRGRADIGIRSATYEAFAGPARGAVVVMYVWSGIAKANTDFFDPMVGCATTLLGTALHAEQNSAIVAWLATPVTAGTLVTEIGLGLLLAFRRTRFLAIPIGLLFHLSLAVVPIAAIQAFSYVAVATYALFISPEVATAASDLVGNSLRWLRRHLVATVASGAVAVSVLVVAVTLASRTIGNDEAFTYARVGLWFLGLVVLIVVYLRSLLAVVRRDGPRAIAVSDPLFTGSPVLWVVTLLVLVNGSLPYLGFKTQTSFTMFSNVWTEDGRTNHWFISPAIQIGDYQGDLVKIIETDDPELAEVADAGHSLTRFEFERALSEKDDISVECSCYGQIRRIEKVDGEFIGYEPRFSYTPFLGKVMSFRSVPDGKVACTQ